MVRCEAHSQIPLDRVVVFVLLDSGARALPTPSAVVTLIATGIFLHIEPFLYHILAVISWHAILKCPYLLFRVKVGRFESSDDRCRQACLHLRIKVVLPIIGFTLANCRLKVFRGECLLGPRVGYSAQIVLSLAFIFAVSLIGVLKAQLARVRSATVTSDKCYVTWLQSICVLLLHSHELLLLVVGAAHVAREAPNTLRLAHPTTT